MGAAPCFWRPCVSTMHGCPTRTLCVNLYIIQWSRCVSQVTSRWLCRYLKDDTIVIRYTIELVVSSGGALARAGSAAHRAPVVQVRPCAPVMLARSCIAVHRRARPASLANFGWQVST